MRRVDDGEARQPRIVAQRCRPADRPAPVMADQCEAPDPQCLDQREYVVDENVGPVVLDVLRPIGPTKAALVGHDEPELVLQQWH